MLSVLMIGADQKSVNAWGKRKLISAINTRLFSLTVANKSGTDFYVQIYDVTGASENAAGAAADLVTPEYDLLCQAGLYLPMAFAGGWQFGKGCYVRCVTAQNGAEANLIGSDDAKIVAAYMDGPLAS